ncbi:flagellar biosynthesis anti-sigma factor FlgM [Limnohabitans sp. 2KL-17]|uniref:flagellar biosynthesis anti-sigma factor FlgM n=1 Tax=Limnohabitans sp. 2KL-17 TaxID=1100704 RepID=UPI000D3B4F97|nr:flagellar biosynthesis anti-sigma factor FlgM [Limnohabitans sp. 2KL-17]PUE57980.1 flagellar biosynthesis anti-sigma factor FlgM [Limnohabitans sp. 2KL-17]
MTDPISHFGRKAQIESGNRQTVAKGEPRVSAPTAEAAAQVASPPTDELRLSSVARQAMQEPEFDRAKVDAIKTAIQQGQYSMDPRRIAESFVAIEKMIKG